MDRIFPVDTGMYIEPVLLINVIENCLLQKLGVFFNELLVYLAVLVISIPCY